MKVSCIATAAGNTLFLRVADRNRLKGDLRGIAVIDRDEGSTRSFCNAASATARAFTYCTIGAAQQVSTGMQVCSKDVPGFVTGERVYKLVFVVGIMFENDTTHQNRC
jgi:hypothetical protein